MKGCRFAVIGGDMRQVKLAQMLAADGHQVSAFAMEQGATGTVLAPSLQSAVCDADCVIFPLPMLDACQQINTPLSDTVLTVEEAFFHLTPKQIICGGRIPEAVSAAALAGGLRLTDYFKREELVVANAAVTAEGAIGVAMGATSTALLDSPVLILGFGRIGKLLALRLRALGAHVTVAARTFSDLAWIRAFGYKVVHMEILDDSLDRFPILFNTVPHLLLDAKRLTRLDPTTLCIDLSSKPGGIDFPAAAALGLRTIWALGLPGEVAPTTSAAIIRDTITNILSEQEIFL